MTTHLDALFELLDDWRHLPNYQLERRVDIFFGLYLPEFLGERFELSVAGWVPKFPVKRDLIWPVHGTNRSVKVDYVAFGEGRKRCLLVELKTDAGSRLDVGSKQLVQFVESGGDLGGGPVAAMSVDEAVACRVGPAGDKFAEAGE